MEVSVINKVRDIYDMDVLCNQEYLQTVSYGEGGKWESVNTGKGASGKV